MSNPVKISMYSAICVYIFFKLMYFLEAILEIAKKKIKIRKKKHNFIEFNKKKCAK